MGGTRIAVWEGIDEWRAEIAHVELAPALSARGTQIGLDPEPTSPCRRSPT